MRPRPHTSAAPSRNIPIGQWPGPHDYEAHRAPLGAVILDAKYCELCGCNFLRRAESKDRYCSTCLLTTLIVNGEAADKWISQLIH